MIIEKPFKVVGILMFEKVQILDIEFADNDSDLLREWKKSMTSGDIVFSLSDEVKSIMKNLQNVKDDGSVAAKYVMKNLVGTIAGEYDKGKLNAIMYVVEAKDIYQKPELKNLSQIYEAKMADTTEWQTIDAFGE